MYLIQPIMWLNRSIQMIKELKTWYLFFIFAVLISILETSAYRLGGVFSVIASRAWLVYAIFYFASSIFIFSKLIIEDVKVRYILGIIALVSVAVITFWDIHAYKYLHHEATQQIGAAFANLKKPDLGYTKLSFIGYSSRQYLIAAVPSFLFGQNAFALRFGFAFQFYLGISLLYTGLRTYFKKSFYSSYIVPIVIISITTFPYVVSFLRNYEQAMYPISFAMQAVGWYLLCSDELTIFRAFNLCYIGGLLATIYSPGIGVWILLILFILINIFHNYPKRDFDKLIIWLGCMLVIFVVGINSIIVQGKSTNVKFILDWDKFLGNIIETLKVIFFSHPRTYFSLLLILPIIAYILSSLCWFNGLNHFIIAFWSLIIILSATCIVGYFIPYPLIALHRANIVIPVLLTGLAILTHHWMQRQKIPVKNRIFWIMLLIFISHSFFNLHIAMAEKRRSLAMDYVMKDIASEKGIQGIGLLEKINIGIFPRKPNFDNALDFFEYFVPDCNYFPEPNRLFRSFDFDLKGIIYVDDSCEFREKIMAFFKDKNIRTKQFNIDLSETDSLNMTKLIYCPRKIVRMGK